MNNRRKWEKHFFRTILKVLLIPKTFFVLGMFNFNKIEKVIQNFFSLFKHSLKASVNKFNHNTTECDNYKQVEQGTNFFLIPQIPFGEILFLRAMR